MVNKYFNDQVAPDYYGDEKKESRKPKKVKKQKKNEDKDSES